MQQQQHRISDALRISGLHFFSSHFIQFLSNLIVLKLKKLIRVLSDFNSASFSRRWHLNWFEYKAEPSKEFLDKTVNVIIHFLLSLRENLQKTQKRYFVENQRSCYVSLTVSLSFAWMTDFEKTCQYFNRTKNQMVWPERERTQP